MKPIARRQRGLVLIMSLIMLVVLTLLAVSAIRLSTVNLRTVANAEARHQALSTAQRAIDCLLSSNFSSNVAGVVSGTCAGTYAESGKNYTVVVARPCLVRSAPVLNVALNLADPVEKTCQKGSSAFSQCSDTVWQLRATSSSGWFGASIAITQGTGIRMDNGQVTVFANDASYRCTGV